MLVGLRWQIVKLEWQARLARFGIEFQTITGSGSRTRIIIKSGSGIPIRFGSNRIWGPACYSALWYLFVRDHLLTPLVSIGLWQEPPKYSLWNPRWPYQVAIRSNKLKAESLQHSYPKLLTNSHPHKHLSLYFPLVSTIDFLIAITNLSKNKYTRKEIFRNTQKSK